MEKNIEHSRKRGRYATKERGEGEGRVRGEKGGKEGEIVPDCDRRRKN